MEDLHYSFPFPNQQLIAGCVFFHICIGWQGNGRVVLSAVTEVRSGTAGDKGEDRGVSHPAERSGLAEARL